jgi:hypothetical protein
MCSEVVDTAPTNGYKSGNRSKYGRVTDVQIVNRSHINSGTGAQLGALVGQARYLDNTSWANYSTTAQIGAGALGALVGSTMDKPTSSRFEVTYWVKFNNGETQTVRQFRAEPSHIPKNVCVVLDAGILTPVNEAKCVSTP